MSELRRQLSLPAIAAIGIQGGLGTGAFFSTAAMAALAGPSAIVAYVIAGAIFSLISLSYLELVTHYPEAGGPARYGYYSHGPLGNLVSAVSSLIWYFFIPIIEAIATIEGLAYYVPGLLTREGNLTLVGGVLSMIVVAIGVPINYFGIKLFDRITNGLAWPKNVLYGVVVLAFLIVLGRHASNFTSFGGFAPDGAKGILLAVPLGIFSFGGVRLIADYAGDSASIKGLRMAMVATLVVETVVLTLFAVAFVWGLDWKGVGIPVGDWAKVGSISGNPFTALASSGNAGWLIPLTVAAAILGPFVASYVYLGAGSRVVLSLGASGYTKGRITEISSRYGTPAWAIWVVGAAGAVITLLTAPIPGIYSLIGDSVAAGYFAFAIVPAAMVILAIRRQRANGRGRAISPLMIIVGVLGFGASALAVFWSAWPSVPYGAILVVAVTILLMVGQKGSILKAASGRAWLAFGGYILFIGFLVFMTAIGSEGNLTLLGFIPATIIVAVVSIAVFFPLALWVATPSPATEGGSGQNQAGEAFRSEGVLPGSVASSSEP